jgi:hypothetical protein
MSDIALALTIGGLFAGLVGALYGTWRRFRPGAQRVSAAIDAVIGKAPITDRSGKEMEPGQPGLVHRVATVEEAVVEFRHMVGLLTETQHTLTDHGARIKALEEARVERLVTQAESAHMWRAVADNNAANDPDMEG